MQITFILLFLGITCLSSPIQTSEFYSASPCNHAWEGSQKIKAVQEIVFPLTQVWELLNFKPCLSVPAACPPCGVGSLAHRDPTPTCQFRAVDGNGWNTVSTTDCQLPRPSYLATLSLYSGVTVLSPRNAWFIFQLG